MKQTATNHYKLEALAVGLFALIAAVLSGWAIALALALWGDARMSRMPPWTPFALLPPQLDGATVAPASVAVGQMRLAGVAGGRAYFVSAVGAAPNARSLSLAVGDALPSGEKLVRIERDAVVLASAGVESRVTVLGVRADPVKSAALANAAKATNATNAATTASICRLSAADRTVALFIDDSVIKALLAERATFGRMFDPQSAAGTGGGIRARGTGGTTALFAIEDGDVLLRADGVPLKTGDAIVTEILARLGRGSSVLVEGERKGAARRWVYAPKACAIASPDANKSSKSSG